MIEEILVRRDGLVREEARNLVRETLDEIDEVIECGGSLEEAEDIVMRNLGLEPDYLEFLLLGM